GNSLLEQYKGVDLSTMTEKKYDKKEGLSWFDDMVDVYRKELCDMLAKYYNCTDHKEKKELRTNIINNVKKQLAEQRINIDFGDLDLSGNDQFFLWHTWFYDVFSQGGFDIVIGNPPYIDSETMMKSMPEVRELYKMIFGTAKGNWDIYVIFFEHGMKLLNDSGTLSFITPNKWISIGYGKTLRDIFFEEIFSLCDCQKIKVFEAGNEPVISIFSKKKPKDINISRFENNYNCHIIQTISKQRIGKDNLGMCISKNFPILANIMKQDKTVGDYIKVENPFSTSEAYELIELLKDHNTSQDFKLINTGTIDPYVSLWGIKTTSYLKGKYIYPTVNRSAFKTKFPKRERQASSPKIIITGMRYFECYYDCDGSYIAGKSTIILLNPQKKELFKLLLGILNSKLIAFYIRGSYSTLGIGGGINFSRDMVEGLPIPILSTESEKIILCVEKVLQAKRGNINSDISALESEIDRLVYQLYGLTDEEIRIVEGKN
ncbi:MAG: Eco57I restriction-modification methylase domain-containing protein, partial [Aeriscardovia sp.]|nr:Eco57I restriction-modification methylase domain-containing protein [Aeriscardovia sp.]